MIDPSRTGWLRQLMTDGAHGIRPAGVIGRVARHLGVVALVAEVAGGHGGVTGRQGQGWQEVSQAGRRRGHQDGLIGGLFVLAPFFCTKTRG